MSVESIQVVSRRGFLGTIFSAGAFVIGSQLLPVEAQAATEAAKTAWHPGVWMGLEPDGTLIILAHRSEMGTGIRTVLPMVFADEMEADWKRVKIEQAIGDAKYGSQNTDGSCSIRDFIVTIREAAATSRLMLERAAAAKWNVPASECKASNHQVIHKSGKKLVLLSGEIVSGGKQDRIVQQDTLIRPSKEAVNLNVFCVEHGRWVEKSSHFAPAAGGAGGLADPSVRGRAQHEKSQAAVWNQVDESLGKLKTDNATKTYQANLNNAGVQKSVDAYVKAIQSKLALDKVMGVAVAVNGRMVWMDCFSDNQMFRKYWPKMIKSYALEALQAVERTPTPKPPTYDEAMRYAEARDGKKTYEAEDGVWKLTKIEAKSHVIYELEDLTVKLPVVLHASKMAK